MAITLSTRILHHIVMALVLASFVCLDGVQSFKFAVTDDEFVTGTDKAQLKVLKNTGTGEYASVIINAGGTVDDIVLVDPASKKLREVIWSHSRNATEVKLNPTWKGRILLPYANRIANATYTFNGTVHHLPINDVAGLNNSLHGLLWSKQMVVMDAVATDSSAYVVLGYNFTGEDKGYPYKLGVSLRYTLSPGGFAIVVSATNYDPFGWPLPFYNGWHPYFLTDVSQAKLKLDPCTAWTHVDVDTGPQYPPPRFSNMIPSGHTHVWDRFNGSQTFGGNSSMPTYFDDEVKALDIDRESCYGSFRYVLQSPLDKINFVLTTDSNYRYLQIFTGAKSAFNKVDAVVLEPLSGMSDSYNNHDGLHVISAGETFSSTYGVYLTALD